MTTLRSLAADFGALVVPVACAGCGRGSRALCATCRAALAPAPVHRRIDRLQVVSGLTYDGPAREVLLALKNHGRTDLAGPLAAALVVAVESLVGGIPGDEPLRLVPMPTTRRSRHERGYDPVRLLLRRGRLPSSRLLTLATLPQDQVLLGRDARRANAAGTMRARASPGGRVVLVDDVVTTGATLREAARAVTAAGAVVAGAATVAAVPLRRG